MDIETLTIARGDERREVIAVPRNGGLFYTWMDGDIDLYPSTWRSMGWEVTA